MNSLNSEALKNAISESGITITALANKIGITRESLYNKLDKRTEFTVSEISRVSQALNLSNEKRDSIFFGN